MGLIFSPCNSNVCAKHVRESKAAMDDPTIVCAKRVAKSKETVNDGDFMISTLEFLPILLLNIERI